MIKFLTIVRHGETDLNKRGIVQGRGIDSDLNETGRMQAEQFYQLYKDEKFDKLYTSTLKRTHQTMAHFISTGIAWEQLSALDELDWGIFEGVEGSDAIRKSFKELTNKWVSGDYTAHFEGGESPLDLIARQKQGLARILSVPEEENVLICMHGRALRIFLCYLTGEPLSKMDLFPHQNLSMYKLEYTGTDFRILEFNNIVHLNSEIQEG